MHFPVARWYSYHEKVLSLKRSPWKQKRGNHRHNSQNLSRSRWPIGVQYGLGWSQTLGPRDVGYVTTSLRSSAWVKTDMSTAQMVDAMRGMQQTLQGSQGERSFLPGELWKTSWRRFLLN